MSTFAACVADEGEIAEPSLVKDGGLGFAAAFATVGSGEGADTESASSSSNETFARPASLDSSSKAVVRNDFVGCGTAVVLASKATVCAAGAGKGGSCESFEGLTSSELGAPVTSLIIRNILKSAGPEEEPVRVPERRSDGR